MAIVEVLIGGLERATKSFAPSWRLCVNPFNEKRAGLNFSARSGEL